MQQRIEIYNQPMNATNEILHMEHFRDKDVQVLAEHLKHHNSVNIIGMKRVGINNFLRYFFSHPEIKTQYVPQKEKNMLVNVDLNDLIERDLFPFWTLTLKRILDSIDQESLPDDVKEKGQRLFSESIQLKDLFVTVDSVRKILSSIASSGYYITLLFNRFDRMQEASTPAFYENLQSLKDHANRQLSFIFTSYRSLSELKPDVFTKQSLPVFCSEMYVTPAQHDDASQILTTFEQRYHLDLPHDIREEFLSVTGGHVQYIHLSVLKLKEATTIPGTRLELIEFLLNNEEAMLQSEELLDSLAEKELSVLANIASIDNPESTSDEAPYLKQTGMVGMRDGKLTVFSPLLRQALLRRSTQKPNGNADFTKKEHTLFTYLQSHEGELCEREAIIEAVWPEYAESGVSDWAVDRLVARVRGKLKAQESEYEITTVITRGYKLVKKR